MCPFCFPGCVFLDNLNLITIIRGQFFTNSHVGYFKNWLPCFQARALKSFFHITFRKFVLICRASYPNLLLKVFSLLSSPTGGKALYIKVLFSSSVSHLNALFPALSTVTSTCYNRLCSALLSTYLYPCCSSSLECPSMSYSPGYLCFASNLS